MKIVLPVLNRIAFGIVVALVLGRGHLCVPVKADDSAKLASTVVSSPNEGLVLQYPLDETIFPPEIASPTFSWKGHLPLETNWTVVLQFQDGGEDLCFPVHELNWTPPPATWEKIKLRSTDSEARAAIYQGLNPVITSTPGKNSIRFKTSRDRVDARIFYREVILPFQDAVTDPTKIRWRMGDISASEPPPVVLENLPVCGNCHSFTRDGGHMAMDVDYANSKGSYIISRTREEMTLATSDIITWDDYRREDQELTFGLLSQISPDGRVVVSTVKDKSVFVPVPKLAYSQLFFPIKGILCWYDRERKEFHALPGADDPVYVQSNPSWSPDGKDIVFARSKAYDLKNTSGQGKTLLTREECKEFVVDGKPFRFELFKIPFNEGKGGEAQPLAGASGDGKSSFFARYSPDGKWIVFCQASNYMLLQPDSALYIIPSQGGEPRRMRCNLDSMNSWHSWSPNSRWLVFSSKANGPYTQLWLTHIDDQGESSPPIVLAKFTAADRAANIPEFVPLTNAVIRKINEKFLNDVSFVRAGNEFYRSGQADQAIANYRKALELNPNNSQAHQKLGFLLYNTKNEREEGANHLQDALRLEPDNPQANFDLGMALFDIGQNGPAIKHISRAIQLIPGGLDKQYNKADMRYQLGRVLFYDGQIPAGISSLMEAIQANPKHADAHYLLALAHAFQGGIDETVSHLNIALEINPALDRMPELRDRLALNYARAGQIEAARSESIKALELARKAGKTELANRIQLRLQN